MLPFLQNLGMGAGEREIAIGVISLMSSRGKGLNSTIGNLSIGALSSITESQGIVSLISDRSLGVSSTINETGYGLESDF